MSITTTAVSPGTTRTASGLAPSVTPPAPAVAPPRPAAPAPGAPPPPPRRSDVHRFHLRQTSPLAPAHKPSIPVRAFRSWCGQSNLGGGGDGDAGAGRGSGDESRPAGRRGDPPQLCRP